ncbi:hypothetical protein SIAM614_05803 [Stappia aggregata IAM 12614]|uniref:Uncharacterized protein n=1 Tax=Roseibium aggregatum (strain ATCC 25650 / DSM 13394 / JCM 20685 / NBRC 16684 / NCIMB 2208 / IAM 12614 / B1) TaxID=384765 RepID=A0NV06_ROSAI|nr:hypothetical protein SIAM614_05803 [Stappia aggregata IAM 12614] [Roseibium aggregatum IAM 12614]
MNPGEFPAGRAQGNPCIRLSDIAAVVDETRRKGKAVQHSAGFLVVRRNRGNRFRFRVEVVRL